MKYCHSCGKKIRILSKFCEFCGTKSQKKAFNQFIIVISIVTSLSFLVLILFNNTNSQLESKDSETVLTTKEKQRQLDQEFYNSLKAQEHNLKQVEADKNYEDQDEDGLTYAQELNLGTSDNSIDSDADGISDKEDPHPAGNSEVHKITVNWEHNGLPYTTQFGIPEDKYLYYKNYQRINYYYQDGRFATPNDPTIQTIAKDITDVSISTGDQNKFQIAVDFVESMVYQYDIEYNTNQDYPKYAIETIIDERGDCEDTSFLMASILKALGIDTILLLYSDHMAVGVYCETCSGTYYDYNGRKYFFLETTGVPGSWEIGRIWGKYAQESPKVIGV